MKDRTATDGQTCRTCGMLFLALSLTIALPPVVINLLMGGEALRLVGNLLTGYGDGVLIDVFGPMLVTFFLPAIIAAMVGAALLLRTCNGRRCGKLLLSHVGFSLFLLTWPLLPIPWIAMGVNHAYASRLDSFSWAALYGLFLMEGWGVFPHVLAIVVLWCLSLSVGWSAIARHGKEELG